MKRKKSYIRLLLVLIVSTAFMVRVWNISDNPPAISWDEASIGYNAYSILTYLRDEHGTVLPVDTFPAFGDYKPPVPVYLTVPFVFLFGLTEGAVRLPSAIAGTVTVFLLFLLTRELLRASSVREETAVAAAAILTVTPWHVMLSRAGFEANIALMFITAGVWLTLVAFRNPRWFQFSWLPFIAAIYTFNSARYAAPLIALPLVVAAIKRFGIRKPELARGAALALLVLLPIMPHLLSKEARLRFKEVSIFTDLRTVLTSNERRGVDGFAWWSGVLHNRRVGYAREYLIHFLDNLQPRFLFITGDGNPKFSIQDTGELLLVTAPFLAVGILSLLRDYPVQAGFLIWWLVASIIPTAVARETPHALRIENALPFYMIMTAYGAATIVAGGSRFRRNVTAAAITLAVIGNFAYFWHNLTVHYPTEYSGEWQYGYKQAIGIAKREKGNYDTIVLTESIGRPYIYALFYERYDLMKFLGNRDASFDAAGFYNVYGFDTYRFTKEGVGEYTGRTLYILPPKDVPPTAQILETIRLKNGTPVLVAFE